MIGYTPMNKTNHILAGFLLSGAIFVAFVAVARGQSGQSVENTRHNLTASGPGNVKIGGGGESCQYCHTPHAANPIAPLWNRNDPGTYYQTYDSTTLVADVPQPSGSSRLCLSCHDGTIALGQTYNSANSSGYTVYMSSGNKGYLGTDLSDDHPISFVYDASLAMRKGELRDPMTLPKHLPLDGEKRLQCTTCHDPHDDSFGKFLRMPNEASALCRACHQISDWDSSVHATSTASLATAKVDKWDNISATTVQGAGCESCHKPHSAGGRQRLLRHEAEEANCLNCHDGSVARTDITGMIQRVSAHQVDRTTGVHDPLENPLTMQKHVECADCHHPHRIAASGPSQAPQIKPSMRGTSGVSSTGQSIARANHEYEVCYKCHASSNVSDPVVDRTWGTDDISREFSPVNASFHPVETQGVNPDVPSLRPGYQVTSMIYCTDCHGSDDANDPKGPHGSRTRPMLRANYSLKMNTTESAQAYAMCYQCHDRNKIINGPLNVVHRQHIVDRSVPCSACHDPHGVRENSHLINFDRTLAAPSEISQTGPIFTDLGTRTGSCTLSCHGKDHTDASY